MKLFAFHLLNDYSGSPKVLSQLVKGWIANDHDVTIVTCRDRQGFLSDIHGATYLYYPYRWRATPLLRLINLFISQLMLIIKTWRYINREDVIYINTVLPFGAALLGKMKGCRVIYHVHETSMRPKLFKDFLFGMVKWAATNVIYVSDYLKLQEYIAGPQLHTLHNALEESFYEIAHTNRNHNRSRRHVLMVCSLKAYKGVWEFLALAIINPQLEFRLVVNATQKEIDLFFAGKSIPANLCIYPTQTNTHPFYAWADIVLNLSRPDGWIETFGLTIIEAMAYGLPVIVPQVGGITELVTEGNNGLLVDSRDVAKLSLKLNSILDNEHLYAKMQLGARLKCLNYSEKRFIAESLDMLADIEKNWNDFRKMELNAITATNKH